MRPDRLTRAMGKVLRLGYDQERAVPLARDLARVPSPNKPAWAGLGAVPPDAAPKREADWWAPAELDLNGIHREHARLGADVRGRHQPRAACARPEGPGREARRRRIQVAPKARAALGARRPVPGQERAVRAHRRRGDVVAPARAGAGRVGRRRGRARAAARARKSVRRRARIVLEIVLESDEGDASFESGDPDAAGGARAPARAARREARAAGAARRRPAAGARGRVRKRRRLRRRRARRERAGRRRRRRDRRRRARARARASSPFRGNEDVGSAGKHNSGGEARPGVRVNDGSRYRGADRSDGPGGGGGGARAPAATEMGTGMDEPEKKRKKRFMLCC